VRWVRALDRRGLDIVLFSLQAPDELDYAGTQQVRVETLGIAGDVIRGSHTSGRKLRYLQAIPMIRRLVREFRPDVCNAHFATSYGLLGTLARVHPLIVSVWGADVYDAPRKGRLMRASLRETLRRADAVLSTSHVMADEVRRLVPREVAVTPFGVDTGRFRPVTSEAESNVLRFGIVKALEPKYGVDVLLRAFALAVRDPSCARAELVIAGDGSQRTTLRQLAIDLGLEGRTSFLGRVRQDQVHTVHQSLDVAVYPSVDDSESFGVSAVESQACGIPVIASAIGGLREVVIDGVTGQLVESRNHVALAQAMVGMAADRAWRARLGAAARAHVLHQYSMDRSVDLMCDAYERTASGPARP
jgi:glycosyltransferase involved in cell wall biosynthesis